MKNSLLVTTIFFIFSSLSAHAVEFKFADAEKAREILLAQDDYFNRMSPAEIAIRVRSPEADKTVADLKAQYSENLFDWSAEEIAQYRQIIEENRALWEPLEHLLPETVYYIKMNRNVEGGFPHTHANAILMPLENPDGLDQHLFFHELFHIISRYNQARHASLYALIGFQACRFDETPEVKGMHLTNPDVPVLGYYLALEDEAGAFNIMTFLYAAYPAYDETVEGDFGGHFGFGLLRVEVAQEVCTPGLTADGDLDIRDPGSVPGFFAAIGGNTGYIIHPEEVLADNFAILMGGNSDPEAPPLPNPEIPENLKAWLMEGR